MLLQVFVVTDNTCSIVLQLQVGGQCGMTGGADRKADAHRRDGVKRQRRITCGEEILNSSGILS